MKILEKHLVERHGRYSVMEGDIMTETGGMTFCWVEDDQGSMIGGPTNIDQATGHAEMLAEQDFNDSMEDDD